MLIPLIIAYSLLSTGLSTITKYSLLSIPDLGNTEIVEGICVLCVCQPPSSFDYTCGTLNKAHSNLQ